MRAVVLVNLGSPDSPEVDDVRRYLDEFLNDPYVIDYPTWIRKLVVHGIVLRSRPPKTAALYREIWTKDGSPLVVSTRLLANAVAQRFQDTSTVVVWAMRYGQPSISHVVQQLAARGDITDVTLVPLYPQYAMATTVTVVERMRKSMRVHLPSAQLVVVRPWYNNPSVIDLLARRLSAAIHSPDSHVILSYHGVPERHLRKTDPTHQHCLQTKDCCSVVSDVWATCYRHQCITMTERIAERVGLSADRITTTFQSRFGPDTWLQPFTDTKVAELAKAGTSSIIVMSPAFVADCLETLEELDVGTRKVFLDNGGTSFQYVPCLNADADWVDVLSEIITTTKS